jgi:hypothetical protein
MKKKWCHRFHIGIAFFKKPDRNWMKQEEMMTMRRKKNLLRNDKVWNNASEKRTSWRDVLSPDRSAKPRIVAKTKYIIWLFQKLTNHSYKHMM